MNRPKFLTRVINFIKALIDHTKEGFQKVSKKEKARRLSICNECPLKNARNECSLCGCYLPLKTEWKEQKCPDGKW